MKLAALWFSTWTLYHGAFSSSALWAEDSAPAIDFVKLCYLDAADYYAAATCLPPTALTGAVFASCSDEERAMVTAMATDPRFSAMS